MSKQQMIEGAQISLMLPSHEAALDITERWQSVGRLTNIETAVLMVAVDRQSGLFGLNVDGTKNVTLKKDWTPDDVATALFSVKVPIKTAPGDAQRDAVFYTEYPANHLRLLSMDKAGNLRIYEISLISQNGDFFVATQCVYQTRVYRDVDGIFCPQWPDNKWPQLMELVGVLLKDHRTKLPERSKCPAPERINGKSLENHTGVVQWYNLAQGYGCVITNKGAARVHWSNLTGMNGQCFLEPGQKVTIGSVDKPKSSLRRTTQFRNEAFEVGVAN